MRVVEWVQSQPLAAAAVAGVLVGALAGLAWPITVPPAPRVRPDLWSPPGMAAAQPRESEFSKVRDAPIWGDSPADAGGPKRANWRLTGIISHPVPAVLVLEDGSTELKRLTVGQSLPDGGSIRQILPSSVRYALEGCTHERLLYGPAEPAAAEPCEVDAQAVR